MDWFHARIKPVRRNDPDAHSAVGLASYVTGEKLWDEENKCQCRRGHPGEVDAWGSTAPVGAHPRFTDPKQLGRAWNDHHKADTRVNSLLALHDNIALPDGFSYDDCSQVMSAIARNISDRNRVMVTWAVHKPTDHGDERNKHGHLALGTRRLLTGSEPAPKTDREIELAKLGFGEKARELVAFHLRRAEREWQRQIYCDVINEKAAELGLPERISPLSFEERGIDRTATKHLGNDANMLELRGVPTDIGHFNREARKENQKIGAEEQAHIAATLGFTSEIEFIETEIRRRKQAMDAEQAGSAMRHEREKDNIAEIIKNKERADAYLQDWEEIRKSAAKEDQVKLDPQRNIDKEDVLNDAQKRFLIASRAYDITDPYASMVKVITAEYAMYREDQDDLKKQIAATEDPDVKKTLQLRHDINEADYNELVSQRTAGQSYVITGKRGMIDDHENPGEKIATQHQLDVNAANYWGAKGDDLREQFRDHQEAMRAKELGIQVGDIIDKSHAARGQEDASTIYVDRSGVAEVRTGWTPGQARETVTQEASLSPKAEKEDPYAGLTPAQRKEEERLDAKVASVVPDNAMEKSIEPGVAAARAAARGGMGF